MHGTSSYLKVTEINFSSLAFSSRTQPSAHVKMTGARRKVSSKADECLQTIPKVNAGDARGNGVSVVHHSSG